MEFIFEIDHLSSALAFVGNSAGCREMDNKEIGGRMELGWTFAILTAAQLVLALMNYILSKKKDKSESVSEDTE